MRRLFLSAAILLVSTEGFSQSVNREISVNGWTGTGNEFVSVSRSSGESEEGEFSYALLQVHDANAGTRLRRFRYGASSGPAQPAFEGAEGAPDGREFMLSNPPVPPEEGNISPDGRWFLDTTSRTFIRPAQTVECPECRACTTQYQVYLIDTENDEVLVLDSGNRDGNRITAPMDPHCVDISVSGYWSATEERFAMVLHEVVGETRFDSLSLHNFGGSMMGFSAVPLVRVERALPRGELRATFDELVASLATAHDRQAVIRELIPAAINAGDLQSARDYLEISLSQTPDDPELVFTGHLLDYLGGDSRALRAARRLARNADGALDHQMALLYYLNGDLDEATDLIGNVGVDFALELMRYDVAMGTHALENATLDGRNASVEIQRMLAQLWFDTGRTSEATRMVQNLDQAEPANYALTLRALAAQGRGEEAVRLGYERLFTEPGNCEIYAIIGDGELAAEHPEVANDFYAAARMCDPNLIESLYTRAQASWAAQEFEVGAGYGRDYARIIGARRGDTQAQARANDVGSYRSRLNSPDLVLWTYSCSESLYTGRTCSGTIINPSEEPVSDSVISLRALDDDGDAIDAVEISYGAISGSAYFEFEASLMPQEELDNPSGVHVILNVTGPDTTSTTNLVDVGPGW